MNPWPSTALQRSAKMLVWSLITEMQGSQGVMAAWGDFPAQFLKVVDGLAAVIPCDRDHPCQRWIVEHAPDDVVGLCDTEDGFCEKRQVSRKERLVYRLDEGRLFAAILKAAGGKPVAPEVIADRPRVLRIGGIPTTGDSQLPVFFALASDASAVDAAVTALLAHGAEKFLLVIPASETVGLVQASRASQREARIVGLDQLLDVAVGGEVSARTNGQELVGQWLGKTAPKAPRDAEAARFPTPPGTQWRDVTITFMDRDMLGIKCGKQREQTKQREQIPGMTKSTTELNMPSVNWFLLLAFAVNGPALSMTDLMKIFKGVKSDAIRRRKSEVSNILQEYFGIDDDPFPYDQSQRCYVAKVVLRQADNTDLYDYLGNNKMKNQ